MPLRRPARPTAVTYRQHAITIGGFRDHRCARVRRGAVRLGMAPEVSRGYRVLWGCVLAAVAAVALVVIVDVASSRLGRGKVDEAPDGVAGSHGGAMIKSLFLMAFA